MLTTYYFIFIVSTFKYGLIVYNNLYLFTDAAVDAIYLYFCSHFLAVTLASGQCLSDLKYKYLNLLF